MVAQDWFESFFVQGRFSEQLERVPEERTEQEVAFIAERLGLEEGSSILDLCCGIGRHTVPLAKRGFRMAGLDLDGEALAKAKDRARKAGVEITWHQAEMRDIPYAESLDAIISWFTSWGFYESDEDDAHVLAAVAGGLKPGGRFMLEVVLNWPVDWPALDDLQAAVRPQGVILCEIDLALWDVVAGIAAGRAGRWERAVAYFETALRLAHDLPHRIGQPEVRRWYADMLLRRREPGDLEKARGLLTEAIAMYREMGMPWHANLAERMLREA